MLIATSSFQHGVNNHTFESLCLCHGYGRHLWFLNPVFTSYEGLPDGIGDRSPPVAPAWVQAIKYCQPDFGILHVTDNDDVGICGLRSCHSANRHASLGGHVPMEDPLESFLECPLQGLQVGHNSRECLEVDAYTEL